MSVLYRDLFYDQTFNTIFAPEQHVEALLQFEKQLAIAQAAEGLIPEAAAQAIENTCQFDMIDLERLTIESAKTGNILIPLIRQCAELLHEDASGSYKFIHYCATSQDALDTAAMIQYKKAGYWIHTKLKLLILQLARLADQYRNVPMIGRTFMQQAKPITLGYKIAGWIDGLFQIHLQIESLCYPIQLGGAVGTWTGIESTAYENISTSMTLGLQLNKATKPWHNQRHPVLSIATAMGILHGHLSKITRDLSLMAQTEIGEISFEAPGKGRSSSMPHKNNPVNAILIAANGIRVPNLVTTLMQGMSGEHERSFGQWHAEWETMEDILKLIAGSLRLAGELFEEIRIHPDRMMSNLKQTNGLIFAEIAGQALAIKLGKLIAHDVVEKSCLESRATGISLETILAGRKEITDHFTIQELADLFKVENNLGLCDYFITQVLNKVCEIPGR